MKLLAGSIEDVGAGHVECPGWVPSMVCAGTGMFEKGQALWDEFVAILQLEGSSIQNPCVISGADWQQNRNVTSCPFVAMDGASSSPSIQAGFSALSHLCNGCGRPGAAVSNGSLNSIAMGGGSDLSIIASTLPMMVAAVETLLRVLGEDPNRAELRLTSARFVRWLLTATQGSRAGAPGNTELAVGIQGLLNDNPLVIAANGNHASETGDLADGMISAELAFPFCSQCEHHLLPFLGVVHVGFMVGRGRGRRMQLDRSNVQRIVRGYSLRLQVQERLTREIAEAIGGSVMVVVEASHMCMLSRGVQQAASSTATYASLGLFSSNPALRTTFLQLVAKRTKS